MHRKDLIKQGFKSYKYGSKMELQRIAINLKKNNNIKGYRVVKDSRGFELYIKK